MQSIRSIHLGHPRRRKLVAVTKELCVNTKVKLNIRRKNLRVNRMEQYELNKYILAHSAKNANIVHKSREETVPCESLCKTNKNVSCVNQIHATLTLHLEENKNDHSSQSKNCSTDNTSKLPLHVYSCCQSNCTIAPYCSNTSEEYSQIIKCTSANNSIPHVSLEQLPCVTFVDCTFVYKCLTLNTESASESVPQMYLLRDTQTQELYLPYYITIPRLEENEVCNNEKCTWEENENVECVHDDKLVVIILDTEHLAKLGDHEESNNNNNMNSDKGICNKNSNKKINVQ